MSPGWGAGGREIVTGIRVPLGLTRNKRSVAGGIPSSDAWVVMRAPAVWRAVRAGWVRVELKRASPGV